jgi:hypothetical protein
VFGLHEPVKPISPIPPTQSTSDETSQLAKIEEPSLFPAAAPGAAAVRAKRNSQPALAALLAGHVLRNGEVVLLILKPSLWFIPLTSLKFAAGMAICAIAAKLWLPPGVAWYYVEAALFLVAGRLMWATLHWMGRVYVLTDQRVLRLSGVFTIDIYDCPLRRIREARLVRNVRERILRLGSIEILPRDDNRLPAVWQMVRRPMDVLQTLQRAIRKSRHGSSD